MRRASLLALLWATGCGSHPQPARSRLSVHGVSGTVVDGSAFTTPTRLRRSGGLIRYESNDGRGLLLGAEGGVQQQRGTRPLDRVWFASLGASAGLQSDTTGIAGGLALIANDTRKGEFYPWLRFVVGDMEHVRVGLTIGPDEPLFVVHRAHLHVTALFPDVEVRVGLSSADRFAFRADQRPPLRLARIEGAAWTSALRWRLEPVGVDAALVTGPFEVARLGLFFDFE